MDAIDAIQRRRSVNRLTAPAPSDDDLRTILEAAACAPDHGELRPFRFAVLRGAGMVAFGRVLEDAYRARCLDAGVEPVTAKAVKERTKLARAPLVVIVSCVPAGAVTIPRVEQLAACAAACQNALVAATALGYGSMWRTGEACYDQRVKAALGLQPEDALVGFLYLGTVAERTRPAATTPNVGNLDGLVQEWNG